LLVSELDVKWGKNDSTETEQRQKSLLYFTLSSIRNNKKYLMKQIILINIPLSVSGKQKLFTDLFQSAPQFPCTTTYSL
jgi:hypothetical protein